MTAPHPKAPYLHCQCPALNLGGAALHEERHLPRDVSLHQGEFDPEHCAFLVITLYLAYFQALSVHCQATLAE